MEVEECKSDSNEILTFSYFTAHEEEVHYAVFKPVQKSIRTRSNSPTIKCTVDNQPAFAFYSFVIVISKTRQLQSPKVQSMEIAIHWRETSWRWIPFTYLLFGASFFCRWLQSRPLVVLSLKCSSIASFSKLWVCYDYSYLEMMLLVIILVRRTLLLREPTAVRWDYEGQTRNYSGDLISNRS